MHRVNAWLGNKKKYVRAFPQPTSNNDAAYVNAGHPTFTATVIRKAATAGAHAATIQVRSEHYRAHYRIPGCAHDHV